MAELNFKQQNILGDCLNVSFGKSSIRDKGYAVNFNILTDNNGTSNSYYGFYLVLHPILYFPLIQVTSYKGLKPHL